jgi:hypothetical protein
MAINFIDVGALQGAAKQDVGAMQSSGAATVNETITLGVSASAVPAAITNMRGAIALGVGAHTGEAAPIAAVDSLELDSTAGVSLSEEAMKHQSVSPAVAVEVVFLGDRSASPMPVHFAVLVGAAFTEQEIFAQTRRGKSAVVVSQKSSGKATVR